MAPFDRVRLLPLGSRGMPTFYDKTREARKVLVLDLGFLGDTIHLLPALWTVRQAYPQAHLEVMVAEHIREIMTVVPWVDEVSGYPRFPKGPKWYQDWGRILGWRKKKYDAVINLNGSDRSSLLTFLTGAPHRLGRLPDDGGPWHWKRLFTDITETERWREPIYRQNWQALKNAGFAGDAPEFHLQIPKAAQERIKALLEGNGSYVHFSPFANDDFKELPIQIVAEVLERFHAERPDCPIVLSCAPTEREKVKMQILLWKLSVAPRQVFPGTLSLTELAALIQGARFHAGGDSGALHVALMTGTPTVSWFRRYGGMKEWMPDGPRHRVLIGEASDQGLTGIEAGDTVGAALDLLIGSGRTEG